MQHGVLARSYVGVGPGCGRRTDGPLVVAYPLTELVAPIRTARGVGNPVSLIAGISSVSRVGRGWALEEDQNCKSIQYKSTPFVSMRWQGC